MYIVHIMNFKINLNFEFFYSNLKIDILITKTIISKFLKYILQFETSYLNLKIVISIV